MSLPSGLIFFLDFTKTDNDKLGPKGDQNNSLFGGGKVGKGIADGVDLTGANAESGLYNLNNGYSAPTGSLNVTIAAGSTIGSSTAITSLTDAHKKRLDHDADLLSNSPFTHVFEISQRAKFIL